MTKDELAEKVAERAGVSKKQAREAIDTIFSTEPGKGIIATELDAGRDFTLTGFGTFGTRRRRRRSGRNPQTGEKIQIPAMTIPTFKAGRSLKTRVRASYPLRTARSPQSESASERPSDAEMTPLRRHSDRLESLLPEALDLLRLLGRAYMEEEEDDGAVAQS